MLVLPELAKLLQSSHHDYLAFVDSWSDLPTCLSRPHGATAWADEVVVFASGRSIARPGVSPTVDSLLVDWPLARWPLDTTE